MEFINAKIKIKTAKGTTLDYDIQTYEDFKQAYESIRNLFMSESKDTFSPSRFEANRCNK